MNQLPVFYYGVAGTHRAGKTTFVKMLAERLRKELPRLLVIELNYADELRNEINRVWPYELGPQKRHPLEREVLQATGEVWRKADSLRWVKDTLLNLEEEIFSADYANEDSFDAVLMIASDVYHVNEALILDRLLIVENVEVDVAPPRDDAYEPASITQTNWMIRNWRTVDEMLSLSGGTVQRVRVQAPEDLANDDHVWTESRYLKPLLDAKLDAVGKPPLERALLGSDLNANGSIVATVAQSADSYTLSAGKVT